jgi:hypothetical protein
LALLAGCEEKPLTYTEVKRLDEPIHDSELRTFLRIVNSLPDKTLPALPSVFPDPPSWNTSRTRPINELVEEELAALEDRWSEDWQVKHLDLRKNRSLALALQRENMTPKQFIGLTLAIGVAVSRCTLPDELDADRLIEQGTVIVEQLRADTRQFSSLGEDRRHDVLQQARWIMRLDRTKRLSGVVSDNMALVRKHHAALQKIFPPEFLSDPLDPLVDRLEEQGVPFENVEGRVTADPVGWDRRSAVIGRDAPDASSRHDTE